MKVLVVEDNPIVALDYEMVLEEAGHQVVGPVATVVAAARLIEREEPDAAILDFHLKRETSLGLITLLSASQTPFVVVTGSPADLEGTRFADRVIVKPCAPDDVIRTLLDQAAG